MRKIPRITEKESQTGPLDPKSDPNPFKPKRKKRACRAAAICAVATLGSVFSMDMNLEANEGGSPSEQTILDEEYGLVEFDQENEEICEAEPIAGRLARDYSVHQLKGLQVDLQAQKEDLIAKGNWNPAESEPARIQSLLDEIEKSLPLMECSSVYMVYNPNSGEHLYTTNDEERSKLVSLGWSDEGICFGTPVREGVPVYRLYLKASGEHLYSTNMGEIQILESNGWKNEGAKFMASSLNAIPVTRLLNPNTSLHHFTSDEGEIEALVKLGWIKEHQAFSVVHSVSIEPETINGITGYAAYNSIDQKLTGLQKLRTGTYYFDPDQEGWMVTGFKTLPDASGQLQAFWFRENGKMAYGEVEFDDGWRYFDKKTGVMICNDFVKLTNPKRTCYFDENGLRVSGKKMINGKSYLFDEKTGAMKMDLDQILDQAVAYIKKHKKEGEDYSLAIRVPALGQKVSWNDHSQQSASVMKLFVMGAIFEKYEDYCSRYGKSYIDSSLNSMITWSDNEAWKNLVANLGNGSYAQGCENLNQWNKAHGYPETSMQPAAYQNFTSVLDASKILEDIDQSKLKHSAEMKKLIQGQSVKGRLLNGIPQGISTGNKPGWLDDTQNDSLIVWDKKGTYVLTFLSTSLQDNSNAQRIMGEVSRMVYEWMQDNLYQ